MLVFCFIPMNECKVHLKLECSNAEWWVQLHQKVCMFLCVVLLCISDAGQGDTPGEAFVCSEKAGLQLAMCKSQWVPRRHWRRRRESRLIDWGQHPLLRLLQPTPPPSSLPVLLLRLLLVCSCTGSTCAYPSTTTTTRSSRSLSLFSVFFSHTQTCFITPIRSPQLSTFNQKKGERGAVGSLVLE